MVRCVRLACVIALGAVVACSSGRLPEHTASGGMGGPGPIAAMQFEEHSPRDTIVMGSLPKDDIRQVIQRSRQQIQYCYELQRTKQPELAGRLVVQFVVAPDGSVSLAKVTESELKSPALEQCVAARFKSWRFPRPNGDGIVQVTYPMRFGAQLDAGAGEVH